MLLNGTALLAMLSYSEYRAELDSYVSKQEGFFSRELKGKRFCISGAAGLIGSYLVDLLMAANERYGAGIEVWAWDKNAALLQSRFGAYASDLLHADVLNVNTDALPQVAADYVIHAASNTSPLDYGSKPVDTIKTNVFGTDRMIELSLRCKARFLFCSSVEMYGLNQGDTDEFYEDYSGYVNANTVRAGYPTAKRLSEALCNAYRSENPDWEFLIARIGRIYGPTVIPGDAKAPSQFINNAVQGEDIVLKSAGTLMFSYGYVGDCAMALLVMLLRGGAGEAYNIADPESAVSLRDFAETAAHSVGRNVVAGEFSEAELAGYSKVTKATMCMDKLTALGWRTEYHLAEGVARTVRCLKAISSQN